MDSFDIMKYKVDNHTEYSRGATVFGNPICPRLFDYLDCVYPDSKQKRLVSMFFCHSACNTIDNSIEEELFK